MARRRRRTGLLTILAVLVLGAAAGAAVLSVILRSQEPKGPPTPDTALRVEVLNGCGSPGAADKVAALLRHAGFNVERVGNADHFHYRQDIVAARTVSRARVESLGRVLGGAPVVEQRLAGYDCDVTVIVGRPRSLVGEGSGG